jgi:AcrR family transcriptional regulator
VGIKERKEREKERRRQQIIVAAKRVFSEKGYNRSTIEDIAQEAELSPGTLYLYFKNKEELFTSLSLRILQYLLIRLKEVAVDTADDATAKLDQLKKVLFDVYAFDPDALINLFHLQSSETLKNLSKPLLEELNNLTRRSLNALAGIFENGIKNGVFQQRHSPIVLADILWSLFSGVILWEASKKAIDEKKDFLEQTLSAAFEIFERGILKVKT